jgi:hypothetical protein
MANFRVSVKSLIEEERKDLAKEFNIPLNKLTVNKVNNSFSSPKMKSTLKRASKYESKKQKRNKKVFNKKEKTNIKKNKRVGNNKKRLKRRK